MNDILKSIRMANRVALIDALRGGPQHLYHYCIGRVSARNYEQLVIYGNVLVDMEANAAEVLRMFSRYYPFIDKLKQGETAHETS